MMKLFVVLISLYFATQEPVSGHSFDEDTGEVDWSGRELGRLLTRYIHDPEIAEKLENLRSTWPFNITSHCRSTNTLDTDYRKFAVQGRNFKLRGVPSCGFNQLTSVKHERQLETQLDKFFDVDHPRNSHDSKSGEEKRVDRDKSDRVVGGKEVVEGAWPWLAAVGSHMAGPRCGGSLIADRWVLTAAHCFSDIETPCSYNVRLGSVNWLYDDEGHHVDITVEAIYRHPDYDRTTNQYDVALLKLSKPVPLEPNGFINAVCLPNAGRSLPVGTVCLAAGWGKLAENSSGIVLRARQVELPIMAYEGNCGQYDDGIVRPGMVCAGYPEGNRDTCQGDSGGPLTHNVAGRWTQIGLTSFGDGCAKPGYPGVYTDVGHHLNWIAAVLERHS